MRERVIDSISIDRFHNSLSPGSPLNLAHAMDASVFRPALGISRTGIVTSTGASAAFLDALNAADESVDAAVHAFKSKLAALAADLQTHGVSARCHDMFFGGI